MKEKENICVFANRFFHLFFLSGGERCSEAKLPFGTYEYLLNYEFLSLALLHRQMFPYACGFCIFSVHTAHYSYTRSARQMRVLHMNAKKR